METPVTPFIKAELRIDRFVIPYRIYGKGEEVMVCINGVQQSMAMWYNVVRRFSRSYRVILFDFPNQGKGQIVSGSSYVNPEEQISILEAVVKEAAAGGRLTICSASWGGVIAAAFAVKHPQRVRRLILASLGTKPNKRMIETIKKGAALPPENRKEMAEVLISSFGQDLPEAVKGKIVTQFQRMSQETLQAFYQHGLFVISAKEIDKVVNLKDIKCKTIILAGEKDTIIDLKDVEYLASQIPNSEIRIIKGVGHFLHLEKEELLDVYADILKSDSKL
ncbi:MAG: alpha/beta hydrolase [Candidatus Omnitrophota bacterium]|nr:MAG: alpha/beta hydrolase [Candidatus Omnitrophota bacterium]